MFKSKRSLRKQNEELQKKVKLCKQCVKDEGHPQVNG